MTIEARLKDLGIDLPKPAAAVANYVPFVRAGNLVHISGQLSNDAKGGIKGTVGDDVVKNVIPTASGDFDVTYTITDDGELRAARLTGVFYEDSEPMSYTVTFEDYGIDKHITAP